MKRSLDVNHPTARIAFGLPAGRQLMTREGRNVSVGLCTGDFSPRVRATRRRIWIWIWICAIALNLACPCTALGQPGPGVSATDGPLAPQSIARARAQMEARVAMAIPGTRVCRELAVGIGERDWIKGAITEAEGHDAGIRIDDPGRYSQAINGIMLVRGVVIRDALAQWMPCL